jgi:F0F1-type ATP synthase delta subunit
MIPALKAIPGRLFGQDAALRLEGLLRKSLGEFRSAPETEYIVRFLSLLVRKDLFRRHIDSIVRQIEKRLDGQKGILEVTVECAAPPDGGFEEYLKNEIRKKTGAPGVKLLTRQRPELLGGYRLRIDGLCVDASLRGLLGNMAKELGHG